MSLKALSDTTTSCLPFSVQPLLRHNGVCEHLGTGLKLLLLLLVVVEAQALVGVRYGAKSSES